MRVADLERNGLPRSRLRSSAVSGHQLRAGALKYAPERAPWLPSPEDAWCLLAQVVDATELLIAGDYLLSGPSREDPPLTTHAELVAALRRFEGCPGSPLRRRMLPLLRSGEARI